MNFGITGNVEKSKAMEIIPSFISLLQKRNIDYTIDQALEPVCPDLDDSYFNTITHIGKTCDLLISFGGDGTMLSTVRRIGMAEPPILGINVGSLGFLAEIPVEEIEEMVDDLIQGRYTIVKRMLLKIKLQNRDGERILYALNDVVIERNIPTTLVTIRVDLQDTLLNIYRCDGVIIATPTGSTAYSLSANGPLMVPTLSAMIVTPICPHALTVRPVILSENSKLKISIPRPKDNVHVSVDGADYGKFSSSDCLTIEKASHSVNWIATPKRDFFKILRTKLNWGADHLIQKIMQDANIDDSLSCDRKKQSGEES
jgi:NAD+ kinase